MQGMVIIRFLKEMAPKETIFPLKATNPMRMARRIPIRKLWTGESLERLCMNRMIERG